MDLAGRVRGILLQPRREWGTINGEATSAGELYRSYVVPLAAIGPVAALIGTAVFGVSAPLVGTVRVSLGAAVAQAVVTYLLTLFGTYVFALVVNLLAATFSGTQSFTQALKVSAYASTAGWLAGIFALIPALGILGLLGLYSIYLLYLGLPVLMKTPQDRALPYTVVAIVVGIVVYVGIGVISGSVLGPLLAF